MNSRTIKLYFLTIIFFGIVSSLSGQKIMRGRVLDQRTKEPIAYANIGILNSAIGGISNEDGSFAILIPDDHRADTLLFSALGFTTWRIPVSLIDDSQQHTVLLSEKITQLEQVIISAKREKEKKYWLGNRYTGGGNIYADSVAAGSAMALLIENKYPSYHAGLTFPIFIDKAFLKISVNTFAKFKVRIRLLEIDSVTKLPGKDFFDENVVVTSRIRSGWVTFDLSSFNIKVDKSSFFLAFEWILDDTDRRALIQQYADFLRQNPARVTVDTAVVRGEKIPYYSWHNFTAGTSFGVSAIQFSLNHYQCYYRDNSFGEWKKASAILTARLQVSTQPTSVQKISSEKKNSTDKK